MVCSFLYVILSEGKARVPTEVELLRVERSEQAKVQGVAAAGYGLKFWWLINGM